MGLFGPPDVVKMKAKRDVKGLIKALGYQGDASVRNKAAEALGELRDARAVMPLIAILKDKDSDVRKAVVIALGQIRDARAVEPLILALKNDEDKWVRGWAAHSLGEIGDVRALDPLLIALEDENGRFWAANALVNISDSRAVEPLIAALTYHNNNICGPAAEALGKIGDARAVEPLIAALKLKTNDVAGRTEVVQALDKLRWQPDTGEAGAAYWIAKKNWDKCIEIGTPAIEPLIIALKDKDGSKGAVYVLDQIGWQPAQDENGVYYWIRKREWDKCITLGALAVEPLMRVLAERSVSDYKEFGWEVVEALSSLYRSGQLDEEHKKIIFTRCNGLSRPHIDTAASSCYDHYDKAAKSFPL
jgi:hypothetical protein